MSIIIIFLSALVLFEGSFSLWVFLMYIMWIFGKILFKLFHDGGLYHKETRQLTNFSMIGPSVMKELMYEIKVLVE